MTLFGWEKTPWANPSTSPSLWWKIGAFLFALAGVVTLALSVRYVFRPAQASGPSSNRVLNYQLRLTDPSGIPVADGTRNIKISFYNDPTLSVVPTNFLHTDCGTPASPVGRKVVFTNGIGTVLIGDTGASGTTNCSNAAAPNAIPATLWSTATLYLGITIDSEISEMTPRKRIVSTGFALNADMLDDLDTSAVGGSIAFVPVTDSSGNLTLTKNLTVDGTTLFVDSTNDKMGIGTAAPITQMHVSGKVPAAATSSTATGTNPQNVYLQGRYAYVVNRTSNTLQIFDVSDPAAPTSVGSVATKTKPWGLQVQGRYAYVSNNAFGGTDKSHLQIFDISNPAAPVSVGAVITGIDAISLYVQGKYAYVGNYTATNRIEIYDVSNPAAPFKVGDGVTTEAGLGTVIALYAKDRYLYTVHELGQKFSVYDVSNPAAPVKVSTTAFPAGTNPQDVTVQGRYAYAIGNNATLHVIDVSNPVTPVFVGTPFAISSISSSGSGRMVQAQGRYVYIANFGANTMQVVDVSNPAAPVSVGTVATGTGPSALAVQGRYAYVSNYTSNTLQVFDIGGSYVQQLEAGGIESGTLHLRNGLTAIDGGFSGGVNIGQSLSVSGNASFAADTYTGGTLTVGDGGLLLNQGSLTTPFGGIGRHENRLTFSEQFDNAIWVKTGVTVTANSTASPDGTTTADTIDDGVTANGDIAQNDIAAAAGEIFTFSVWFKNDTTDRNVQIKIQDNGTTPASSQVYANPSSAWRRYTVTHTASAGTTNVDALIIDNDFNVGSEASNRFYVWGAQLEKQSNVGVYVRTESSAITSTGRGLIVDSAGPHAILSGNLGIGTTSPVTQLHVTGTIPTNVGSLASAGGASISVQGRYAYTTQVGGTNTLSVIDVSNPTSPILAGSVATGTTPVWVHAVGKHAYVSNRDSGTVQIYDITNPTTPTSLATVASSGTQAVYAGGRYAYSATSGGNLHVIDVSNPSSPSVVGTVVAGGNLIAVHAQGRYAYATDQSGPFLKVFDVSNPTAPTMVGFVATGSTPYGVSVQGRYAYVVNWGADTLQVIDVRNPASPSVVGTVATNADPRDVQVQGRYVYVSGGDTSPYIQVFDVSNPSSPVSVFLRTGITTWVNRLIVQGRYAYIAHSSPQTLTVFDLGGSYLQQLEAGGVEAGTLSVRSNLLAVDGAFSGGISVGQSLKVSGRSNFTADASFVGSVGIGTITPVAKLTVVGGGVAAETLTLSSSFGSILGAATGFSGYTNLSGGIGTGGVDSITPASRLTPAGNLVNIGSIQAGGMNLTRGGTFAAKVDYTAGTTSRRIAIGDVNGDGKADMVVANGSSATASVFINSGTGTFAAKVDYTTGSSPEFIALGDVNGDGKADMVVANYGSNTASVFINNGNGTFAAKVDYTTGSGPAGIALGDVNGDGKADMVVANSSSTSASVLMNSGTGTFAAKVDYTTGSGPYGIALGDVNGDGKADMVVVNFSSATASVFINSGTGTFAAKVDYTTGTSPLGVALGDVNGDGKADMVVANSGAASASVLINNASSLFFADASTGNVGIETASPITQFHVPGRVPTTATGSAGTNIRSVYVQGNYAYTVTGSNTLQIFDVSNPTVPLARGSVATSSTSLSVHVQGRYAYATTGSALQVFDVSNPSTPAAVGSVATGSSSNYVYVQGRYAYVVTSVGLEIYDVSNPAAPILVSSAAAGNGPYSVYVQGRYAYVVNSNSPYSLQVFDVSNPTSPVSVGSVALGVDPARVFVQGRYAYVTHGGGSQLRVIDVSNPTAPVLAGTVATGTTAFGVHVQGRYAYVTNQGASALQIFDVSNPASPVSVGSVATSSTPYAVFVQGRYAYVGGSTLQVFDFGGSYIQQLEAGGIEAGTLSARNNLYAVDAAFSGGVTVGQSLNVSGNAAIGTLTASGQLLPALDDTYDLGSSTKRWRDLYLGPASLHIGVNGNEARIGYNTTSNRIEFDPDGDGIADAYVDDTGNFTTDGTIAGGGGTSAAFLNGGNGFGGAATLGTNDNFGLNFETNGTTKLSIDTTGNVSVGTSSPSARLTVQGSNSVATMGSDLVTNGTFAADANWTKGSGWTISSGVANKSAGANTTLSQNISVTSGRDYHITVTVNTTTAGALTPKIGAVSGVAVGQSVGTLTAYETVITANATGSLALAFQSDTLWAGTIDDVIVKEMAETSALFALLNSDGSDGVESRSGGSNYKNTYFGLDAGHLTTTGQNNAAFGQKALYSNTTGSGNAGFGLQALYSNTNGIENSALGYGALFSNTTGTGNTAVGYVSMLISATGIENTAVGSRSLTSNTAGNRNTAVGYNALRDNSTGINNTAIGNAALITNSTGSSNTIAGYLAMANNSTGSENTASGVMAMRLNTTGGANTAFGYQALYSNAAATANTGIGYNSLQSTTGGYNTAVGYYSLRSNTTAVENTAVGYQALQANTTGNNNVAFGALTLVSNTTGGQNTAIGHNALNANTAGSNTAVGHWSMRLTTSGGQNTALGNQSLENNTTGAGNVAVGNEALKTAAAAFSNTAVGYYALRISTTGSDNTAVGDSALLSNTTGARNTAFGKAALAGATTANNNIAIGYQAGYTAVGANAVTTGSNNTFVGYNSGPSVATQLTNAATLGYNALVGCSNCLALGGTGGDAINVGIGKTTPGTALDVVGTITASGDFMPAVSPTAGASSQTITTVDSTDSVGNDVSIAIGGDGLPVMAYLDATNLDLKVTKCGNAACSSGNTVTSVDTTNDVGYDPSIAIGADGLPVISHYDNTNDDLKVTKCGNAACSSGNTTTTVDSGGDIGGYSSIAVGTDGFPIVSYLDASNYNLKVTKCGNAACSSGNTTTTVESSGDVGWDSSVAIGTDGMPVISYRDSTSGMDLKVVKCGNAACSSGNTITAVDTTGDVGNNTSLVIGTDGLPVITEQDHAPNYDMRIIKCGNAACSSGNTFTSIDTANSTGQGSSVAIGTDGLPVASYFDATGNDLKVVKCGNMSCTSGNTITIVDADAAGYNSSLAIGTDGLPVVAYYYNTSADLKVVKCADAACKNTTGGAFSAGSNVGSLGKFFNNVYANSYWGKQFQIEGFDLAETYRVRDASIQAGDIVRVAVLSYENGMGPFVEKADGRYDPAAIGVVSTKPGIALSEWGRSDDSRPIALAGRVPVKVSAENGQISVGDAITASSTPGVGMKATVPGRILGFALSASVGDGTVELFVDTGWWNGSSVSGAGGASDLGDEVLLTVRTDADLTGHGLLNVRFINGEQDLWRIDAEGRLVAKEIDVDKVMTRKLTIRNMGDDRTAGTGVLPAGSVGVLVQNPNVDGHSLIGVTFEGDTGGRWWISEKADGKFMINLSMPALADTKFTYWIVGVEEEEEIAPIPTPEPAVETPEEQPPVEESENPPPNTENTAAESQE